jgi:hypothetical protein
MNRFIARVLPLLIVIAPIVLLSVEAFARAGGGRNSGGGILGLILMPFFIVYGIYVNSRLKKRQQEVETVLKTMALREPQWAKQRLLAVAREKFLLLQAAWGSQDLDLIRQHLHPTLYPTWETQINSHKENGIRNIMAGLSINEMRIVDAKNFADNEMDEFTVCFDAKADDQMVKNGEVTKSDKDSFREFWTFEWEKDNWVLLDITECGGWKKFVSGHIVYEPRSKRKAS